MLVSRKSLAQEVAEKITGQIEAGTYSSGEKLPIESELMKLFGVGRSTIREAIKILSNTGLLRVQQGLGTFVEDHSNRKETIDQRLKRAKALEVDEVRQLLELKIAEKAALHRSQADLKKISRHLADRNTAAINDSLRECIDADIAFHTAIAVASKNEILADLYQTVANHLKNGFLSAYTTTESFKATHSLHKKLYDAIEAKDAKKAWEIAAKIINH